MKDTWILRFMDFRSGDDRPAAKPPREDETGHGRKAAIEP
jgi:hypothetical protein